MRVSSQLDTQSARTSILTKCSVVFTLIVSARRYQGSSIESDWIFRCTEMFSDKQDDFDFLSDEWPFNHRKPIATMFLCVNTCLSYLFSFCRDRYVCWLVGRVHSQDVRVDRLSSRTFQRDCYSVNMCFSRFSLLTFPFCHKPESKRMGIEGLHPLLKSAIHRVDLKSAEFRGTTCAVDTSFLLHRGAYACAGKLAQNESTDR